VTATRIGVIGTGTISHTYLEHAQDFGLDVVAVSDIDQERAREAATRHDIQRACTTEELLAAPDIDVVLDLTIPAAHAQVNLAAIAAGKHVYTEKPLATERQDGRRQLEAAATAGLKLGAAPDTFLGAGIQTCRALIDEGAIGTPLAGTIFMTGHGHESWHPAPEFYYRPGGGPLFDMGPYYLTALVALLGPVRRVTAGAATGFAERTIGSGPRQGTVIPVDVRTHVAGVLEFAEGALVNLAMSFDVWAANLPHLEIYGEEGSISGPDPNTFAGPVRLWQPSTRQWHDAPLRQSGRPQTRGIGLADLVESLQTGHRHRASGELTYHVLDVMCALLESASEHAQIEVHSTCERPAPLTPR
jgi:predicted dehydrogenase